MHPNPAFRGTPPDRNLAFARARGFGTLMVNGAEGPLASHVPFDLSGDGKTVDLHLVRSNPIVRALGTGQPAVIAVTGPDAYISPDWYGIPDQVPTWNYVAVHLRGHLDLLPAAALLPHLDRLSDLFEARLSPKPVWKTAKMTQEVLDRFMRMIVPVRLTVTDVQGTWKLGQNKADGVRERAADAAGASPVGQEVGTLAGLMRAAKA